MNTIYRKFLRTTLFVLLLLLFTTSFAQYPVRQNAKNANGERIGEWIIFYDSAYDKSFDQPDSAYYYLLAKFKDGKPIGLVESFHMNGIKNWSGYLLSLDPTVRHGKVTIYHPNGNIGQEAIYQYDSLHGMARTYHDNGMLSAVGELRNNKKVGNWEEYYPNGNLRYKGSFVNGKEEGMWEMYHENGAFKSKGLFKGGKGQGYWEYFHDNGQLASKGVLVDNNYEGRWLEYHENGQLAEDILFKNDLKHGKYTGYFANGKLEVTGHFIEGKAHGDFAFYHDNGNKFSVGRKENDELVGIWENYHPNGQLKSVGSFKNDKKYGTWKFYSEEGYLESISLLENDFWNGPATFYAPSGSVLSKGNYVNDKKEGEWIYYNDKGVLIDIANYVQDMYHGALESYYADGTLAYKGLMQNDKKEGAWVFYNEDGTSSEGSYHADLMHGYFKRYHATGELSEEGNYIDNQKDGEWKYYYENGAVKAQGSYASDLKVGPWKYYSSVGQVQVEGNYEQGVSKGIWKYYYENGKLSKVGEEIADDPIGLWTYYDEDGDKDYEGNWHYGKKHGEWRAISKSGTVIGRDFYNFDKKLNFQTYYDSVYTLCHRGKITEAQAVVKLLKSAYKSEFSMGVKYSEVLEAQGSIYRYSGDYKNAKKTYTAALDHILKYRADTSTWYLYTLPYLAQTHAAAGDFPAAISVYRQVIDLVKKSPKGIQDPNYVNYLNWLAAAISDGGNPQEAFDLVQTELAQMKIRGVLPDDILTTHLYLVRFASDLENDDVIIKLVDDLHSYANEVQLTNHWVTANAYYYKGRSLSAKGQSDASLECYQRGLEIYRAIPDTTNGNFVNTLLRIGDHYYSRSDYNNAKYYYEGALIRSDAYGMHTDHIYRYAMFSLAKVYVSMGHNTEALNLLQQFITLEENSPEPLNDSMSEGYQAMAIVMTNQGSKYYEEADAYYRMSMDIYPKGSKYNNNYWNAGILYADFLADKREAHDQSIQLLKNLLVYGTSHGMRNEGYMAKTYNGLGKNFYRMDQFDSAKYYYLKAIETVEANEQVNFNALEEAYGRMADIHETSDDYTTAQAFNFKALELIERQLGKDNVFYATRLRDIASNFNEMDNSGTAIVYFRQALDIFEKLFSKSSLYYLNAKVYMAEAMREDGEETESLKLLKELKTAYEVNGHVGSSGYIYALVELGKSYEVNEDFAAADALFAEIPKLALKVFGEESSQYARYIRQYGNYLSRRSKYDQAYYYLQAAIDKAQEQYGKTILYAWYADDLADVQMKREKFVEALALREEASAIYAKDAGEKSDEYLNARFSVAEVYRDMGRFSEAVTVFREVIDLVRKYRGAFSYSMKAPINALGETYWRWKKPAEALNEYEKVHSLLDSLGANRWNYAELFGMKGLLHYELGHIEQAKKYGNLAIHISDSLWGKDSNNSMLYRNNHAFTYMHEGEYEVAEDMWLLSGTLFNSKTQGDLSRVRWLDNMAALYLAWGKLDKAGPYWTEVTEILLRRITGDFAYLSESGKAAFWDANKDNFEYFNTYGIKAAAKNKVEVIGQMYDNQLVTKGILLSTSTKERKRILNSGDSTLIASYFRYTDLKDQLARYYGYTKEQLETEKISIPALEQQAARLEKVLSMDAEALSVEEKSKAVRWRTIQRSLKPGEAAMEIVRFRYFDRMVTDSVIYAALILTPETKLAPKLVLLPNGNALENQYIKAYKSSIQFKLKDERSYSQFWQAIDQELKGVKQLYLSLDGVFNQINIGTLLKPDGTYVRDAYNMRLLSSTRDMLLIQPQTRTTDRTAYLFGFPKYDLAHATIENMLEERGMSRSRDIDQTADLERFGFTELPGTKTETEEITRLLESKNWLTNLFLSDKALEEDLKAVSNPSVLHIATHGFFLDDVQKKEGALELGVRADVSRENPLLRSGLLLTGAAQTARGEINPGIENGIFTAYEAMNLNLQQTELVVLSACETGRGEIKNGEGVYGLQRAFQIAGAEAIIMSLWKVDDAATQMLMTEFYRAWTAGMTKSDALRNAQDVVKASYGHPYYWGAFVLVGQ